MMKGLLAELDEEGNTKEGGIQVEAAVMMPSYMKNDEQKAIFANAKVNDVLVFNPYAAWDGNAAELASLLKIEKEAATEMKSNFSYQVEEITRFVEGELNPSTRTTSKYLPFHLIAPEFNVAFMPIRSIKKGFVFSSKS